MNLNIALKSTYNEMVLLCSQELSLRGGSEVTDAAIHRVSEGRGRTVRFVY